MDDSALESLCRSYADADDFKSLAALISTNRRAKRVCQPILKQRVQAKEKENPRDITPDWQEEAKPEYAGDDEYPIWTLGEDFEWNKIKSPNRVVLWGKHPFTIRVPHEEEEEEGYEEIILQGPVTLRKLIDSVNDHYKPLMAKDNVSHIGLVITQLLKDSP